MFVKSSSDIWMKKTLNSQCFSSVVEPFAIKRPMTELWLNSESVLRIRTLHPWAMKDGKSDHHWLNSTSTCFHFSKMLQSLVMELAPLFFFPVQTDYMFFSIFNTFPCLCEALWIALCVNDVWIYFTIWHLPLNTYLWVWVWTIMIFCM